MRAGDAAQHAQERKVDKAVLGSLQQTIGSQASIHKHVAQAVVTQVVAEQVDQCAPSTAL